MSQGLAINSTLRVLRIGQNAALGDQGGQALAVGIVAQSAGGGLNVLAADGCEIGTAGAAALGSALGQGARLVELFLENNPIGEDGAEHIAAGLCANSALQLLSLTNDGPLRVQDIRFCRIGATASESTGVDSAGTVGGGGGGGSSGIDHAKGGSAFEARVDVDLNFQLLSVLDAVVTFRLLGHGLWVVPGADGTATTPALPAVPSSEPASRLGLRPTKTMGPPSNGLIGHNHASGSICGWGIPGASEQDAGAPGGAGLISLRISRCGLSGVGAEGRGKRSQRASRFIGALAGGFPHALSPESGAALGGVAWSTAMWGLSIPSKSAQAAVPVSPPLRPPRPQLHVPSLCTLDLSANDLSGTELSAMLDGGLDAASSLTRIDLSRCALAKYLQN